MIHAGAAATPVPLRPHRGGACRGATGYPQPMRGVPRSGLWHENVV
jgi:hypothetical protein